MNVAMRREEPGDAEALDALHHEAFGGDAEAQLVRRLRAQTGPDDYISWVATSQGRVVGHVLFTPVEIDGRDGVHDALALAPLAVHPARQRLGIGTRLMRQALGDPTLGERPVLVLGDPAYYNRFGFVAAERHGIEPPEASWIPHYMVRAGDPASLPRGRVRYPPCFREV